MTYTRLGILQDIPISSSNWDTIDQSIEKAWENLATDGIEGDSISSGSQTLLKKVWYILSLMFQDNMKYAPDFRYKQNEPIVLNCCRVVIEKSSGQRWGSSQQSLPSHTVGIWCFNPAASFSFISKNARSIILTSGTLYPFDSFKSELGINFQNILEASHVINLPKQLFSCVVSQGKDKHPFQITFKSCDSYAFQGKNSH